LTKPVTSQLV